MSEIWKPAPGADDRYEVSNMGRIRSIARLARSGGLQRRDGTYVYHLRRSKMLKPHLNKRGYPTVWVVVNGLRRERTVHRFVCAAFKGPPPFPSALCRHLDDDKSNGCEGNLDWGTRSDNAQDAIRNGRMPRGERHGRSKLSDEQVSHLIAERLAGASGYSLARKYKVTDTHVYNLAKGNRRAPRSVST